MNFNDFFSSSMSGDFLNFKYNYKENHDWDKLKKIGYVEEQTEEKDGFKTITRTFVSIDGETKITAVTSEPIINIIAEQLKEIRAKKSLAIKEERYEDAAKLRNEEKQLLEKQNKK
jgi:hypothetical protein